MVILVDVSLLSFILCILSNLNGLQTSPAENHENIMRQKRCLSCIAGIIQLKRKVLGAIFDPDEEKVRYAAQYIVPPPSPPQYMVVPQPPPQPIIIQSHQPPPPQHIIIHTNQASPQPPQPVVVDSRRIRPEPPTVRLHYQVSTQPPPPPQYNGPPPSVKVHRYRLPPQQTPPPLVKMHPYELPAPSLISVHEPNEPHSTDPAMHHPYPITAAPNISVEYHIFPKNTSMEPRLPMEYNFPNLTQLWNDLK